MLLLHIPTMHPYPLPPRGVWAGAWCSCQRFARSDTAFCLLPQSPQRMVSRMFFEEQSTAWWASKGVPAGGPCLTLLLWAWSRLECGAMRDRLCRKHENVFTCILQRRLPRVGYWRCSVSTTLRPCHCTLFGGYLVDCYG